MSLKIMVMDIDALWIALVIGLAIYGLVQLGEIFIAWIKRKLKK